MSINDVKEVEIKYFEYLSNKKDCMEYMSIQKWHNGEGYTIFNDDNDSYSFTLAQWDAIRKGIKFLENECDIEFNKRISNQF